MVSVKDSSQVISNQNLEKPQNANANAVCNESSLNSDENVGSSLRFQPTGNTDCVMKEERKDVTNSSSTKSQEISCPQTVPGEEVSSNCPGKDREMILSPSSEASGEDNSTPSKQNNSEVVQKGTSHASDEILSQHSRTTSGSCTPEPFLIDECPEPEAGEGRLPLLDAVLGYINSAVCIITHTHVQLVPAKCS